MCGGVEGGVCVFVSFGTRLFWWRNVTRFVRSSCARFWRMVVSGADIVSVVSSAYV